MHPYIMPSFVPSFLPSFEPKLFQCLLNRPPGYLNFNHVILTKCYKFYHSATEFRPWSVVVNSRDGEALPRERVAVQREVAPGRHHPRDQVPTADAEGGHGLGGNSMDVLGTSPNISPIMLGVLRLVIICSALVLKLSPNLFHNLSLKPTIILTVY